MYQKITEYIEENFHHYYGKAPEKSKAPAGRGVEAKRKSGLNDFGFRAYIYELENGSNYTVKEVEQMKLYDYVSHLDYIRALNKYERIMNR